jgi:hypothetical protein
MEEELEEQDTDEILWALWAGLSGLFCAAGGAGAEEAIGGGRRRREGGRERGCG